MKSVIPLFLASISVLGYGLVAPLPAKPAPRKVIFGRDVMPILGQKCFKCHGPDAAKVAAGLRLDSLKGAEQAIVPGSPSSSRLIRRVSSTDPEIRMPPPDSGIKPLSKDQIEILRNWIKQGATFEKHWAFVPPVMPKLPYVHDVRWEKNPIDQFVLAKLESEGLKPEPEANRETLALRAAETLTGLPPTLNELESFRKDTKPGAYERYVDRLIAKPTYGEHQARYWLDAVRYGDTHGLQLDNERGVYPYRDWVVRAYNQDLPFTKFVEWQLAGDLLPKPTTEQLVATGYVRMNLTSAEGGAIEEEFLARNTFDRVDTTSTVMLGLTVQCAKCHDHKYDPIKQRDYYGLYAFFNSTTDSPLDGNITLPPPFVRAASPDEDSRLAAISRALDDLRNSVSTSNAVAYFQRTTPSFPSSRNWQMSPIYTRRSFDEAFDASETAEPGQPGTALWKPIPLEMGKNLSNFIKKDNSSAYVKGTVHLNAAKTLTFGVSSDDGVKVWLNGKLIHSHKASRGIDDEIDHVSADFRVGDNELIVKVVNGAGPDGLNLRLYNENDKRMSDALLAFQKSPNSNPAKQQLCSTYLQLGPSTPLAMKYRNALKAQLALETSIPMSLIAREMPKPRRTFILKRGQYDQKGEAVVRHIPPALGILPVGARRDRLGLAQWLISPANPLVARVFVNRIWQQHFGTALVKTAEDFGTQGEYPLNQPLLDYLAVSFQQNGWSIKKLNRLIVTSATFRQSSRITQTKLLQDPENRLTSRGPRFRLDAEMIRDKALLSGGLLSLQVGGRGFKPYQPDGIWENASDPASATHVYVRDHDMSIYRRSMYLFWKRTAPPPAMLSFDAPLRDSCVVRRSTTNTPLQALTLENEPAFLEAARSMALRLLNSPGNDQQRMRLAFNIALSRPPRKTEEKVLRKALDLYRQKFEADIPSATRILTVGDTPQAKTLPISEQASWMIICSTLMNTDEFLTLH